MNCEKPTCRSACENGKRDSEKVLQRGDRATPNPYGKSTGKKMEKHGASKTPEYRAWADMKTRCLNPTSKSYGHYGGRGITICESWVNSFSAFFRVLGKRPSENHSIDRIDNDGNYEPGNCRWTTQYVQCSNTRTVLELGDGKVSQEEMARRLKSSSGCIFHRRKRGLPVDAPTHSLRKGKWHHNATLTEEQVIMFRKEYALDKKRGCVAQMARREGVSRDAVYLAVRGATWRHLL
jgi:hypothetical protein